MSELENDIIVSGTLLTGEKAVDDLAGVIVTTVCNPRGDATRQTVVASFR